MVAVVTKIMHVFGDALPHVPEHRRLPILCQLVTTLGPARFLWVLMLLLFKLHATQSAGSTSEKVTIACFCFCRAYHLVSRLCVFNVVYFVFS